MHFPVAQVGAPRRLRVAGARDEARRRRQHRRPDHLQRRRVLLRRGLRKVAAAQLSGPERRMPTLRMPPGHHVVGLRGQRRAVCRRQQLRRRPRAVEHLRARHRRDHIRHRVLVRRPQAAGVVVGGRHRPAAVDHGLQHAVLGRALMERACRLASEGHRPDAAGLRSEDALGRILEVAIPRWHRRRPLSSGRWSRPGGAKGHAGSGPLGCRPDASEGHTHHGSRPPRLESESRLWAAAADGVTTAGVGARNRSTSALVQS